MLSKSFYCSAQSTLRPFDSSNFQNCSMCSHMSKKTEVLLYAGSDLPVIQCELRHIRISSHHFDALRSMSVLVVQFQIDCHGS